MNDLTKILDNDIDTILKSGTLSLLLMRTYSKLYLNNAPCRMCAGALRGYYYELLKTGKMKMELIEQIKNRTLVPAWKGIKHVIGFGTLVNSETITDEQAIRYLNKGILKKEQFITLPTGFGELQKLEIVENSEVLETPEVKKVSKKRKK